MPNLNEQDRADRDSFEAWAKLNAYWLDRASDGTYFSSPAERAWHAWQAARRQHGSAAQAVLQINECEQRSGFKHWGRTFWRDASQRDYDEAPAEHRRVLFAGPPVADAEADVRATLETIAAYPKTRADELSAEQMRDLARAALSRRPAAAPEATPWLETEEGKAAIAKAVADVDAEIAVTEATPGGNGAAGQAVAYCKACQSVGMSNCGNFDECGGPQCVTCHRPFDDRAAAEQPAAEPELLPLLHRVQSADRYHEIARRLKAAAENKWNEVFQIEMAELIEYIGHIARAHLRAEGQGSKDSKRLDFVIARDATWHPRRFANGDGILCYDDPHDIEHGRLEARGATMRVAIDAAKAKGADHA